MATLTTHTETSWFLGGTARIHAGRIESESETAVVEITMPHGAMAPLHVQDEDETIYVVEGEVTFYVGADVVSVAAGDCFVAPRGIPHTYRVDSEGGARWVVVTTAGRY